MFLRLDDEFCDHPKIVVLSDAAFRLHVAGLNYCGRNLTDGLIPKADVPRLVRHFTKKALQELVGGLWHEHGHDCPTCPQPSRDAFYAHDFLRKNPTKSKVQEARDAAAQRQANWRETKTRHTTRNASRNGVTNAPPSRPEGTRDGSQLTSRVAGSPAEAGGEPNTRLDEATITRNVTNARTLREALKTGVGLQPPTQPATTPGTAIPEAIVDNHTHPADQRTA